MIANAIQNRVRPADGPAMMHILEGVPSDQVAARKGWMTERSQPAQIAKGRTRVVFPRRAVAIVEIPNSGGQNCRILRAVS